MTEQHRLFELGRIVATPGALKLLAATSMDALALLCRHVSGDWSEVPPEDANENELSVREGFRILSSYPVGSASARVWIISEHDRTQTTILLPEDY